MILASTDKNKEVLEKYREFWDEIKNQNKTINDGECNSVEPSECKKDSMKIRFVSDDDLLLGKILRISVMVVVTGSVFQKRQ